MRPAPDRTVGPSAVCRNRPAWYPSAPQRVLGSSFRLLIFAGEVVTAARSLHESSSLAFEASNSAVAIALDHAVVELRRAAGGAGRGSSGLGRPAGSLGQWRDMPRSRAKAVRSERGFWPRLGRGADRAGDRRARSGASLRRAADRDRGFGIGAAGQYLQAAGRPCAAASL